MITETDEIAEAIELAALNWPSDKSSRTELLRHLIATGIEALKSEQQASRKRRTDAIREAAGMFSGMWPEGWREEMRNEWPE